MGPGLLLQRMNQVHSSYVLGLTTRPDGLQFASASGDQTIGEHGLGVCVPVCCHDRGRLPVTLRCLDDSVPCCDVLCYVTELGVWRALPPTKWQLVNIICRMMKDTVVGWVTRKEDIEDDVT